MPDPLLVTIITARWIVRRFALPLIASIRLGMGFIPLALMLFAEFTFVLWLRGVSISEPLPVEILFRERSIM
jgi:hypothetical protein